MGGGTWSVLLGSQYKNDCIEINLVINWWTLPLEPVNLIGLLTFSFKMLKYIVASRLNREISYTCIGSHSSLK